MADQACSDDKNDTEQTLIAKDLDNIEKTEQDPFDYEDLMLQTTVRPKPNPAAAKPVNGRHQTPGPRRAGFTPGLPRSSSPFFFSQTFLFFRFFFSSILLVEQTNLARR